MRTIFLTLFEGIEGKNILRTPILSTLLSDPDIRLVLFVGSDARRDHFAREFTDPRILFEVVPPGKVSGLDSFFHWLRFNMLRSETTALRAKMLSEERGGLLYYYFSLFLHFILARPLVRSLARWADFRYVRSGLFAPYFEKYRPALLVTANLFEEHEIHFLRAAKKAGVKSVAYINTWDKVTARSAFRLLPDSFITFNSIVKDELVKYHDVNPKDILVAGVPQYDQFFRPEILPEKPIGNRERFFESIGIDPDAKMILYAPMGAGYSNSDWDMIDLLHEYTSANAFGKKSELFVRFPPNDFVDPAELELRPWLRYYEPGIRFTGKRGGDWDMRPHDLSTLNDTLSYASVVICYASSISIDAALFDIPVVNIDFELRDGEPMIKSPTRFFDMTHYQKALATGGISLAKDREELVRLVSEYLGDPSLDRSGRKRLALSQAEYLDGRSGERIGMRILELSRARQ